MFVQVKLLQGYQKILTYKIPESWDTKDLNDAVITVPLKNRVVPALVIKTLKHPPGFTVGRSTVPPKQFEIKEAVGKDHLPDDPLYANFIKKISQLYFTPPKLFYRRIRKFVHQSTVSKQPARKDETSFINTQVESIKLTAEQAAVVDYVIPQIKKSGNDSGHGQYAPTLLHGVTGSGKTEIYKKIISFCIEQQKTCLLIIPEVSLSIQFEHLLSQQLPKVPIFSFHSASKTKEKKQLWDRLKEKKPCLIIGVHQPVMLPISNLGCIIVDEEHEAGFQEKKHPKINSKEMALWRAKQYNIPILLGSATPSINSLHNAKAHNWKKFHLTKRFSGDFPTIKTVKIDKPIGRKNFWITRELQKEITKRLETKEQTLIYLNRRGYSFFVQCKQCGYTFICPNCSVSLTLHNTRNDSNEKILSCHYCDHKQKNPTCCSECKAPEKELRKRGIGTQQVVNILQELFPQAKIARADLDTTKKKREWRETVKKFENGEIDILVGTQTITKGYHFPKVTLVGIIWADLNAHFPVFNANETTLQQLIQVAGRAGRQSKDSLVIAQIMHDHPIFSYLNEKQYLDFCEEEMKFRKETLYPPFGRLVQIELKNTDKKQIEADSKHLFEVLIEKNLQNIDTKNSFVSILGPTKPLVHRIQKTEIRHIFLKSSSFKAIFTLLSKVPHNRNDSDYGRNHSTYSRYDSQIFVIPT